MNAIFKIHNSYLVVRRKLSRILILTNSIENGVQRPQDLERSCCWSGHPSLALALSLSWSIPQGATLQLASLPHSCCVFVTEGTGWERKLLCFSESSVFLINWPKRSNLSPREQQTKISWGREGALGSLQFTNYFPTIFSRDIEPAEREREAEAATEIHCALITGDFLQKNWNVVIPVTHCQFCFLSKAGEFFCLRLCL